MVAFNFLCQKLNICYLEFFNKRNLYFIIIFNQKDSNDKELLSIIKFVNIHEWNYVLYIGMGDSVGSASVPRAGASRSELNR